MTKRMAVVVMACALAGLSSAAENLKLSGYFKNFSIMFSLPPADSQGNAAQQPLLGISNSRLRLNLVYSPKEWISFQAAYDLSPRIQDPFFFQASPFAISLDPSGYRVTDLRTPLVPGKNDPVGSFGLYQNLDRLSVTARLPIGDLIVGRQPIAWGSGRVINPTDVIAPFSFHELDKEERYGVDAVRLRIPLASLSELDLGYIFGKSFAFDQSAFFIKNKFYVLKTDLTVLLLGFRRDLMIGLDLARAVGGAGAWLEAACVFPGALRQDGSNEDNYFRLTAGIDTSLNSRTYGFIEYHFNSAGSARPDAYPALFIKPAYVRGSVYLMGRHYISAGANYQLSPLVPVTGLIILNASDGSFALSVQAEYNVAENIYLGGGAYLGIGKRPGTPLYSNPPQQAVLKSEFGSYPDFAFVSFRLYF